MAMGGGTPIFGPHRCVPHYCVPGVKVDVKNQGDVSLPTPFPASPDSCLPFCAHLVQ